MTYEKKDGTRFTLIRHDNREWAEEREQQLLKLGCSALYASKTASGYRTAERIS